MIERYTRPEMGRIWTLENKYRKWLQVELAVVRSAFGGRANSLNDLQEIKEKANFDVARIAEIEKETQHDVIAFLTNVAEYVGPASRHIHEGLTSSDVLDTSLALLLVEASDLLLKDLEALIAVLKKSAYRWKDTVMIGRSHGIHAEPITLGLKFALWYAEMKRHRDRLRHAREAVRVGMLSGAVGTYANIDPIIEEKVCAKLGLEPAPISNQIIQRDRHAEYFTTLALIGCSIEKIASGNQAPAAHGSARGRRILCRRSEGLFRHAPQAKPHRLGKPHGSCPRAAGKCPGRHGKCSPLA